MGIVTPQFLTDLETRMQVIQSSEFQRLVEGDAVWWPGMMTTIPSLSAKERLLWFLDSARIERTTTKGGDITFEDMVSVTTEYENKNAAAGLEIGRNEFEDSEEQGVKRAAQWSRNQGFLAARWPQDCLIEAILANRTTYDGLSMFHAEHPINKFATEYGTYANDFTGAVDGSYPGALPIDDSVSESEALDNLNALITYVTNIKMPNGKHPRGLKPNAIYYPSALRQRVTLLTSAEYIARVVGGVAASSNVAAVIARMGLTKLVEVPELGAAFGGSDTTYYVGMQETAGDELGAFAYVEREPFATLYHGPVDDASLARMRKFQWINEGRNIVGQGHPYKLMRCQGA